METTDNSDFYKQKLKESMDITQRLLSHEDVLFSEIRNNNQNLQELLGRAFTNAQSALPLFESIEGKLNPDENQQLVQFATMFTKINQELFEFLKSYRGLESRVENNLSDISQEVIKFTKF